MGRKEQPTAAAADCSGISLQLHQGRRAKSVGCSVWLSETMRIESLLRRREELLLLQPFPEAFPQAKEEEENLFE